MENVIVQVFRVFVNDTLMYSSNFKLIYSLTSTFIFFFLHFLGFVSTITLTTIYFEVKSPIHFINDHFNM